MGCIFKIIHLSVSVLHTFHLQPFSLIFVCYSNFLQKKVVAAKFKRFIYILVLTYTEIQFFNKKDTWDDPLLKHDFKIKGELFAYYFYCICCRSFLRCIYIYIVAILFVYTYWHKYILHSRKRIKNPYSY